MSSPGEAELPKICCTECLAKILEAMQCQEGNPMIEEESPNEAPLSEDNIIVIMGLKDETDEDQEMPDNIIMVINEDDEIASNGDDKE